MEIERKYLITTPPQDYASYPFHIIEQAYLCTDPVVRIRKEDETYYLTYKSKGLLGPGRVQPSSDTGILWPPSPKSRRHRPDQTPLSPSLSKARTLSIELDVFQENTRDLCWLR